MTNNYNLNLSQFGTHKIIGSFLKGKRSILDVGCNDGYLKKIFPNGIFTGIDFSKESGEKALKNGYRKVVIGDLNSFSTIKLRGKFDVIIFADVLEHLIHPQDVLEYFIQKNLRRGGTVVISLPNVANFTIRLNLFFGKFNYTNSGILDKTHLHLYTKTSAEEMLQKSGLKIISNRYSSNRFGLFIKIFPILGSFFGYNLIYLCKRK